MLVTLATVALPAAARPQTAREALLLGSDAHDLADFETAVRLLRRGLDPSAGVNDSLWVSGVHRLADALLQLGADSVAGVWMRWALRQFPDMGVDDTNFPPRVVTAFQAARSFVRASTSLEPMADVTWEWSAPTDSALGALRIEQSDVPISGRIEGGEFLTPGVLHRQAPGSYDVLATAAGFFPARVTAEVLPGATTVIRLILLPTTSGFLYVVARPWGEIYLDEKRIGYTPMAAYRVAPGEHRLQVQRNGYVPFDTTITVGERERVRIGTVALTSPGRR